MRRYAYTLMLSISIVVVGLLFGPPNLGGKLRSVWDRYQGVVYAGVETVSRELGQVQEPGPTQGPGQQAEQVQRIGKPVVSIENEGNPDAGVPAPQAAVDGTPESQAAVAGAPAPQTAAVLEEESKSASDASADNFEDTLFIGDSRTVGLKEYADLGEADVFASSGMSVFKIFDTRVSVKGKGKPSLEELLTSKEYKRIYLMLGINELGYGFSRSSGKYREVVGKIQSLQPHAVLYLEANLHVTKHKSDSDPVFQNAGIDKFNRYIKDMTDGSTMIYLDVNELFDDGTGSLAPEYTADDSHVLGKYYAAWAEWIKEKSRYNSSDGASS